MTTRSDWMWIEPAAPCDLASVCRRLQLPGVRSTLGCMLGSCTIACSQCCQPPDLVPVSVPVPVCVYVIPAESAAKDRNLAQALQRVLHCVAVHDTETGYCQGMNYVAQALVNEVSATHLYAASVAFRMGLTVRRQWSHTDGRRAGVLAHVATAAAAPRSGAVCRKHTQLDTCDGSVWAVCARTRAECRTTLAGYELSSRAVCGGVVHDAVRMQSPRAFWSAPACMWLPAPAWMGLPGCDAGGAHRSWR